MTTFALSLAYLDIFFHRPSSSFIVLPIPYLRVLDYDHGKHALYFLTGTNRTRNPETTNTNIYHLHDEPQAEIAGAMHFMNQMNTFVPSRSLLQIIVACFGNHLHFHIVARGRGHFNLGLGRIAALLFHDTMVAGNAEGKCDKESEPSGEVEVSNGGTWAEIECDDCYAGCVHDKQQEGDAALNDGSKLSHVGHGNHTEANHRGNHAKTNGVLVLAADAHVYTTAVEALVKLRRRGEKDDADSYQHVPHGLTGLTEIGGRFRDGQKTCS